MERSGKCAIKFWLGMCFIGLVSVNTVFAECDPPGSCGGTPGPGYENSKAKQFAQKFLDYQRPKTTESQATHGPNPKSQDNRSGSKTTLTKQANGSLSLSALEAANKLLEKGGVANKIPQKSSEVIFPEQTQTVAISAKDRNRFVCTTGPMEAIRYSEEKYIMTEIDGNEGYIKFQFEVSSSGDVNYTEIPSEFFIKCGGETYSIIAYPTPKLSAKTYYLVSPASQAAAAEKASGTDFSALSIDDAVARITELTFKDQTPTNWTTLPLDKRNVRIEGLSLEQTGNWWIRGIDAQVSLYLVHATKDIEVSEWDFLKEDLAVNPVGISVRNHHIEAGAFTPMVIIQKVREEK